MGLLAISCSGEQKESKDDQFCVCLTATRDLNEVSSKLMDGGITKQAEREVKQLRAKKDKLCKPYAKLSGDENKRTKTSVSRTLDRFWISPSDPPGARTQDPRLKRALLYQLS